MARDRLRHPKHFGRQQCQSHCPCWSCQPPSHPAATEEEFQSWPARRPGVARAGAPGAPRSCIAAARQAAHRRNASASAALSLKVGRGCQAHGRGGLHHVIAPSLRARARSARRRPRCACGARRPAPATPAAPAAPPLSVSSTSKQSSAAIHIGAWHHPAAARLSTRRQPQQHRPQFDPHHDVL